MYMDFVRDFKDKWYVVQPSSQAVVDVVFDPVSIVNEDKEVCYDGEGNPEIGQLTKFPIHWCSGHYEHSPGHYHAPAGGMSVEDE